MKSDIFVNSTKSNKIIWATCARKFVANKFQKSPNLVTLLVMSERLTYLNGSHALLIHAYLVIFFSKNGPTIRPTLV